MVLRFLSGSKIAGALSYSWETKDNLVGVVTPIEAMLPLWEEDLWGGGSYSGGRGDPGGKAYFFFPSCS